MTLRPHIQRPQHLSRVSGLLRRHPAVAILGARQVGKTTLAREVMAGFEGQTTHFDLEDMDDLARLEEPKLTLGSLQGLVVIDEVQRRPDLFANLRVLIDRPDGQARFLLLGSASGALLRQSSETLAGRVIYHDLEGFDLCEVGRQRADELWLRGGFPRSFLAESDAASFEWRRGFVRTFLERDLPQLGVRIPAQTLHRFWRMLAHNHGQLWNGAEFGRAFGVAHTTVRRYLDLLCGALVVRQLAPWHENLAKRQVKSPKVYLADSGLLHTLLDLDDRYALDGHPKIGASWEGFVISALARRLGVAWQDCHFWAAHAGPELDLLVCRGQRRLGFEIKRTTSPRRTRSMHRARAALKLDSLDVIHAGDHTFPLGDGIRAVSFGRLFEDISPLV